MNSLTIALMLAAINAVAASDWQTASPRDEIRPQFHHESAGGRDGAGCWLITADNREGLHGWWTRTLPAKGGQTYKFSVWRKVSKVPVPRRSVPVRLRWLDGKGQPAERNGPGDEPITDRVLKGFAPLAEPEYPADGATDAEGWTEVAGLYRARAGPRR